MSARDRESAENKEEAIWSGLKDKELGHFEWCVQSPGKSESKNDHKEQQFQFIENKDKKDELIQAIVGSLQVLFKRIGWVARKDHLYLSGSACGLQ